MSDDGTTDGKTGESWRKNGTCGACSFFQTDFGQPPTLYGHCKMYPRNASRTSNDSTCKEFRPLPGFEEKVVLNPRVHVPDSRRAERRPVDVDVGSVIKRRRDGDEVEVVPEVTRQFFQAPPPSEASTAPLAPSEERADRGETPSPAAAAVASGAIAGALSDPGGGVDPQQMDDAMLDVVESFGVISDVRLIDFEGGLFVLRPGDSELKSHEIEIDALFHKFVMIRDRLRVLEQKVNANGGLSDLDKIELHVPITRTYGALTAFNGLFRPSAPAWRQRRPTRRPLEELLRRHAPRESVEIGAKWVGGTCRIQAAAGKDEDPIEVSIDLLFDRVCRLRRRLRDLERAVQHHPRLAADDKSTLLDYVSKSYGSLTTFNVLFRHRDDWFSSK